MTILPLLLALHVAAVRGTTASCPPTQRNVAFQTRSFGKTLNIHLNADRFVGFATWSNAKVAERRSHAIHTSIASSSQSSIDSLNLIRGGGALPLLEHIPTPSTNAVLVTSKLFTISTLLTGTYALFAPINLANFALKGVVRDAEADSFDSSLVQSVGAIAIGFALHIYLALTSTFVSDAASATSLGHAMGYALLPRILLITWSFLRSYFQRESDKGEYQFEGTSFLKINYFMMSWTAFSLLTGAGNPSVSAKVFSAMSVAKSIALVLKPVKMTEKIFGINVSGEEMAQSCFLSSSLGYYLAIHAILMLSLACDVNPNVAVGTTALAWTALSVWIPRAD